MAFGRITGAYRRARGMLARSAVQRAVTGAGYSSAMAAAVLWTIRAASASGVRREGGISSDMTVANALRAASVLTSRPELLARINRLRQEAAEERGERAGLVGALATAAVTGIAGAVISGAEARRERIAAGLEAAPLAGLAYGELGALAEQAGPMTPAGGAPLELGQPSGMRLTGSGGTMAPVAAPTAAPRVSPDFWRRLAVALANRGTTTRQPTPLQAYRPVVSYRQPTALVGRGIYSGYSPYLWR